MRHGTASAGKVLGAAALLVFCSCSEQQNADTSFVPVSRHGFDAEDNERDFNDYPWAMELFAADGDAGGHLYVGTGNSMMNLIMSRLGITLSIQPLKRPPEIRRYRPDLGPDTWERVFDYRSVETGPEWETSGFRSIVSYTARSDSVTYIYAGTLGSRPALWRSPTGDRGAWELVRSFDGDGSIRALAVHNGRLYIAVSHEVIDPPLPGELFVTDGDDVTLVNHDGFGNPDNTGIYSLASFNGWLMAGTGNIPEGFEVWKLECADAERDPVRIVSAGGPFRGNQAAGTMQVFDGSLYVGALIFAGINLAGGPLIRGADMIRIHADDSWETVVGPGSVGGVGSGFDKRTNAYLWSMEVHKGYLYCGTWDAASFVPVTKRYLPDIRRSVYEFLFGLYAAQGAPTAFDILTGNGAELYRTADGVDWEAVFTDGLGNPDNYGVRSMEVLGGKLVLGMSNIDEGLEIWREQ